MIMTYVQRIRDLREDMDITQEEVAKILNTTQGYYSKYELGIRKLPIDHLITLCKFYNVTADYILGLTDNRKKLSKWFRLWKSYLNYCISNVCLV